MVVPKTKVAYSAKIIITLLRVFLVSESFDAPSGFRSPVDKIMSANFFFNKVALKAMPSFCRCPPASRRWRT